MVNKVYYKIRNFNFPDTGFSLRVTAKSVILLFMAVVLRSVCITMQPFNMCAPPSLMPLKLLKNVDRQMQNGIEFLWTDCISSGHFQTIHCRLKAV